MTRPEPSWNLARSFLAVMREGTLSGAARRLGLTQPTLGRHIELLEGTLGTSLFTRAQNGLTPTEAAFDLLPHAQAMDSAAAAFVRAASGEAEEARGTVRLTASEVIGTEVLPAILTAFRKDHPAIAVELHPTGRSDNLLRREADVAVRMYRPVQGALLARRLGRVAIGLYAHRDYVMRHGVPGDLDDLKRHCLIGYDRNPLLIDLLSARGIELAREDFALRCDRELTQLALLRAAAGIGGMQCPLAAGEPDLLPVLHDKLAFALEMWLVMHEDLRASRRVRLLFDHLADSLTAYCADGHPAGDRA